MARTDERVVVTFRGDNTQLARTLTDTEKRVASFQSSLAKLGKAGMIGAAFAGTAVAAGAGALAAGVREVEQLDLIGERFGRTIKDIQVLERIAAQTDTTVSKLVQTMDRMFLAREQVMQGRGAEQAAGFATLGISEDDLKVLDTAEKLFERIAEAFRELASEDADKARAALTQIFGRRLAQEVIPTLNDYTNAQEEANEAFSGWLKISEESGDNARKMSDAWSRLTNTLTSAFRKIAAEINDALSPTVIARLDKLSQFISQGPQPGMGRTVLEGAPALLSGLGGGVLGQGLAALGTTMIENRARDLGMSAAMDVIGTGGGRGTIEGNLSRVVEAPGTGTINGRPIESINQHTSETAELLSELLQEYRGNSQMIINNSTGAVVTF